ncbi:YaaA family protein [Actinoallomurus rhizosphaericola]|uniref:YaaA family protein n=1 Tax=Actinoallomurus rhizosphaericola TaxID=2952536 RepID=UPI002090CFB5|nr:peroxide stress protein YaaA [Actinoallomurus rhizosphaericola]MCO5993680.1 peroxide stress protein YaaA [Actinoallomurus rhizosphaericola]
MLILLPPSEGKAGDGDGPPLDPSTLSLPGLAATRERVLDALDALCSGPAEDARQVLGLSAGQSGEIAHNRALRTAATLPASRLYTGVLYDNLGLPSLDPERTARSVLIFSALWGALRPADRIPPYRLSMGVRLPPLGPLAAVWRPALTAALPADGLLVDMRSAPYAAAWKAPAVRVRVFREREGRRTVVSHMAKATRGALARDLLANGADPATPEELLKTVLDLGHAAELNGTDLDLITH